MQLAVAFGYAPSHGSGSSSRGRCGLGYDRTAARHGRQGPAERLRGIDEIIHATDPAAPGAEGFWVASVSGSGEQALDWTVERGEWALVIMNADGSPGVSADVRFGVATLSVLFPIGLASLVVGLVALVSGGRMVTSLPSRLDATPRWTLRGRSVLPTSVEGRVAVLCSVLVFVPFMSGTVFGAPIFLFLGARKGDRGLLLVLPLVASIIVIALVPIVAWNVLGG